MRPHGNTNEGPLVCRGRSYPTTPPNPAIRVGAINPKIFDQKILFPITALTPTTLVVHLSLGKRISQGARGGVSLLAHQAPWLSSKKFFHASLPQLTLGMPGQLQRGLGFEESLTPIALLTTGTRKDEPHRGTNMGDPLV